MNQPM